MPLGKLHISEVAMWVINTWEVAVGKMPLEKYQTTKQTSKIVIVISDYQKHFNIYSKFWIECSENLTICSQFRKNVQVLLRSLYRLYWTEENCKWCIYYSIEDYQLYYWTILISFNNTQTPVHIPQTLNTKYIYICNHTKNVCLSHSNMRYFFKNYTSS